VHRLEQQDGDRVGLLAGRARRDPDAYLRFGRLSLQHLADACIERLPARRVAEERRHRDEDVLGEPVDLGRARTEEFLVRLQRFDVGRRHAPREAPTHRGFLVVEEVVPGALQDEIEEAFVRRGGGRRGFHGGIELLGPIGDRRELAGDLFRRHHEVDAVRLHRRLGHPRVLRRGVVLREGHAACRVDRADAVRAVRAGAGQHDADRRVALVLGDRGEQHVDRGLWFGAPRRGRESQVLVVENDVPVRRRDVDDVRLDPHAVLDLADRERRLAGEQLDEQALVSGRQVLRDHVRHPRVGREVRYEDTQRLEPAGGSADAHHQPQVCGRDWWDWQHRQHCQDWRG
jgi:hypothetical protein